MEKKKCLKKEDNKENNVFQVNTTKKLFPYPSESADLDSAFCFGDSGSLAISNEELNKKFNRANSNTVNKLDGENKCALVHYAAIFGDANLFKMLKEKYSNTDLNLMNGDGKNPLALAFFNRNESAFTYLLKEDLQEKNYDSIVKVYGDLQSTLPMFAAVNQVPKRMCNKLLQVASAKCAMEDQISRKSKGTSFKEFLNRKDAHGNTALILAAKNGHKEFFAMLLDQDGIDTSIANNEQKTVYDYVDDEMQCLLPEKK